MERPRPETGCLVSSCPRSRSSPAPTHSSSATTRPRRCSHTSGLRGARTGTLAEAPILAAIETQGAQDVRWSEEGKHGALHAINAWLISEGTPAHARRDARHPRRARCETWACRRSTKRPRTTRRKRRQRWPDTLSRRRSSRRLSDGRRSLFLWRSSRTPDPAGGIDKGGRRGNGSREVAVPPATTTDKGRARMTSPGGTPTVVSVPPIVIQFVCLSPAQTQARAHQTGSDQVIQFDIDGRRTALQSHEADELATALRELGLAGGAGSVAVLALSVPPRGRPAPGVRLDPPPRNRRRGGLPGHRRGDVDVDPTTSIHTARLLLAVTAAAGMSPRALVHLTQPEPFHLIDVPALRPAVGEEFLPALKACATRSSADAVMAANPTRCRSSPSRATDAEPRRAGSHLPTTRQSPEGLRVPGSVADSRLPTCRWGSLLGGGPPRAEPPMWSLDTRSGRKETSLLTAVRPGRRGTPNRPDAAAG